MKNLLTLGGGGAHLTAPAGTLETSIKLCYSDVCNHNNFRGFMSYNQKNAFTLAEVLITLGIIGVVAAMTMPVLLANSKKQETVSKLKKNYSILSQALIRSEGDNGEFANWETGANIEVNSYFEKYWKPYLNSAHICPTAKSCGYDNIKPWKDLKGNMLGWNVGSFDSRIAYMLNDGTFIFMPRNTTGADGNPVYVNYFYIDINGKGKPNVLGKDVFIFTSLSGGRGISPYCSGSSERNIDDRCSLVYEGGNVNCCTAKIAKDGWVIKDDYPW